jgi:hypothetical protein
LLYPFAMLNSKLKSGLALLPVVATLAGCSGAPVDDPESTGETESAVTVRQLRGVDSATVFSDAAARRLKDDYGVKWTGVYIGGACDGGSGWSKSRVESIHGATGWSFLPIYVGQETESICGSHDLSAAKGREDGHDAASRMKDFGWDVNKGIPVTLDVEERTYADNPAETVDYVRAWTRTVKADGYRPYVYSSPAAVNAFARDHLDIDAVWVASDFYGHFEDVSPYGHDLDGQIGHNFGGHNRAWQYAGAAPTVYIEDVGYVDCDVADLELAPKPGGTNL